MINENIYGSPEIWTNAQYLRFAKYANFNTVETPQNHLIDGSNKGKTPTGERIENSICTQALGTESLYCHVTWVHDGAYSDMVTDDKEFVPYFYSECESTDRNVQTNTSSINPRLNCNSWKPYVLDDYYVNMSGQAKPIVEYNPKKIVYEGNIWFTDEFGYEEVGPFRLQRTTEPAEMAVIATHPYVTRVSMRPWVDSSNTDTPNREIINSNALFGVSPNIELNTGYEDISVNYAYFRSCIYNEIPIWGIFGSYTYFDDYYTGSLCEQDYIIVADNIVKSRRLWNDDFKEYLIRQMACFGVFLRIANTPGYTLANIPLDHEDIICGLLDDQGVGHGDYTRGAANRTNPIWSWDTNRDSPYDPYKEPDPNKYENETSLAKIPKYQVPYHVYIDDASSLLTRSTLPVLINEVANLNSMMFQELFLGQEPLSNIIGARRIFLKPPQTINYDNVILGAYTANVQAYQLADEWRRVEFPSKPIVEKYGNFLDYEPYTTLSIYIPYCGVMQLPSSTFMGHSCKFTLNINNRTGDLEALIYVDNIEYASLKGNAAFDLGVSGIAAADFLTHQREIQWKKDDLLLQTAQSIAGYAAGATISYSMGNFGGVAAQTAMAALEVDKWYFEYKRLDYELDHIAPMPLLIQKATATVSCLNCLTPFILISRPKYDDYYDEETYSKTIGHACYRTGMLSDFKGLTVAGDANLDGISATLTEKQLILNALTEGVILDG